MDPILAGMAILFFTVLVPALLATLTLKTYLYALGMVILASASYLWLIEKLAPSPSASRSQAGHGLFQVYPSGEDSDGNHASIEASPTYVFPQSILWEVLQIES